MGIFKPHIGFSIVAAAFAIVVVVQHQSERELREQLRAISEERDHLRDNTSQLQSANEAVAKELSLKDLPDYKEDERIRLRRRVTELKARLDGIDQVEKRDRDEVNKLRLLNGSDEDGKLQIRLGASRDEVLTKLHQSGAEIVSDNTESDVDPTNGQSHDKTYVWATVPRGETNDDGVVSSSKIDMEFFFFDGKLIQGLSGPRDHQQSVSNWDLTWALPDPSPSSSNNEQGR